MQFRHKKIDYTIPSGHEGGPGVGKQITPYFGTPYLNMTEAVWQGVKQATGADLGSTWTLGGDASALGGNTFMFVKAYAALALGQVVSPSTPTTGTVTNNAGQTTTASVLTNINNAATVAANGDADNWLWITATGATLPQLRRIKTNTSSATARYVVALPDYMRPASPTDADVFDTLATNGDACSIIRPYHCIVCTASLPPMGIALGTVTQYRYTIIQIAGLASVQVDADGLNEGLTVNVPAVTAAAGCIKGSNAAANLYKGGSLILPQITTTAAATTLMPAYVNFKCQ